MQRIKIVENDNTTNQVSSTVSRGSVFIPGFATDGDSSVSCGELKECKSLNEFYGYFGTTAPQFVGDKNYYPYSSDPTPVTTHTGKGKDTLASVYGAEDSGDIKLKLKDTTIYSETKSYLEGEKCIYEEDSVLSVYKCSKSGGIIVAEPWNAENWTKMLSKSDVVKVTSDPIEEHAGKTTFYELNITSSTELGYYANFSFLQESGAKGFPAVAIPLTSESDTGDYSQVRMFEDGDYDPSWLMAEQYLSLGLPVVYVKMNKVNSSASADYDVTPKRAYEFLFDFYSNVTIMSDIMDKGEYNIEFLTSGGYPVLEHTANIDSLMINVATPQSTKSETDFSGRGDCIVLLDHTNNPYRDLIGSNSIIGSESTIPESKYAAVFTPWCQVNIKNLKYAPASFVYLYNVGVGTVTGNTWNIYAGVGNGRCTIIKKLNTQKVLTNRIAEYYQNDYGQSTESNHCSINAITYVRNYGYCIWGNRTCEKYIAGHEGFALSFVNIRNLVSEVKKHAYFVSQQLMFEVNDDVLWAKFRSKMSTLLDTMKNGNGLEGYSFIRNVVEDKTKLSVAIILYPTYGVESIEINVRLEDNTTAVEEDTEE